MYHPQCELLTMAHETPDLDAGQPHLTVSGVASIPAELSFHLLHSLDAAAAVNPVTAPPQSTIDYFLGGADPHQQAMQYEPLPPAAGGHHQYTMDMFRDYCDGHYPTAEPYIRGTMTGALVFGATDDDDSAAGVALVLGRLVNRWTDRSIEWASNHARKHTPPLQDQFFFLSLSPSL